MRRVVSDPYSAIRLPIFIVVGIVPLVVRMKGIVIPPELGPYRSGWALEWDLFVFWKACLLVVCGAVIFTGLLARWRSLIQFFKSPQGIFSAVFLALLLVSTLHSPFPRLALWGFPNYLEGALVYFVYFSLMIAAFLSFREPLHVKLLFYALCGCLFIVCSLAILQNFGIHYVFVKPFSYLLLGGGDPSNLLNRGTRPFSTLMNPNHLALFISLALPIPLVLFLWDLYLNPWISGGLLVLSMVTGLLTDSFGFTAALVVEFMFLAVIFLVSSTSVSRKRVGLVFVALLGAVAGFHENIVGKAKHVYASFSPPAPYVRHLSVRDGVFRLVTSDFGFQVSSSGKKVFFSDLSGFPLAIKQEKDGITFADPQYKNLRVDLPPTGGLSVNVKTFSVPLFPTPEGIKFLHGGRALDTDTPERSRFGISDSFGAGRGFIWNRTLPILERSIFVGRGLGTLTLDFPQWDLYGKAQVPYPTGIIVDRPHNFFLQIWHGCGLLALLCLIGIFAVFLWRGVHRLTRTTFGEKEIVLLAVFLSVVGYCVNCLTTDSMIGVSGIFWVFLGVGFATVSNDIPRVDVDTNAL